MASASLQSGLRLFRHQLGTRAASSQHFVPTDRSAFLAAAKRNDVARAWEAYKTRAVRVDKYMLSALVALVGRRKRSHLVQQLWRSVRGRGEPAPLDAHLSSDFITAFGATGKLAASREVLAEARAHGVATTRVYNSYLAATLRALEPNDDASLKDVSAAERLLSQMMESADRPSGGRIDGGKTDGGKTDGGKTDGGGSSDSAAPPADEYSIALGTALLGRAGRFEAARSLVAHSGGLADTVVLNTLIAEAARAGEVQLALSTLQRMEEHGPPPDEASYTSALLALVRAPSDVSMPIDLVATAEELRERMRGRGVEESAATRTSLLQLFADTTLAESVLSESPSLNPGQHYPATELPDDVSSPSGRTPPSFRSPPIPSDS